MLLPLLQLCLKCFSGSGPQPAGSLLAQAPRLLPPLSRAPRRRWHHPVSSPDLSPDIFQLFAKLGALPSRSVFQSISRRLSRYHREVCPVLFGTVATVSD